MRVSSVLFGSKIYKDCSYFFFAHGCRGPTKYQSCKKSYPSHRLYTTTSGNKMASEPVKLYFFPTSFYSQKVVIALKEKGVAYTEKLVTLPDLVAPWLLRMNPNGQVPFLQVGERIVIESDVVIDEVNGMSEKNSALVPAPGTSQGDLVKEWRQKMDRILAQDISYGIMLNEELHKPDTMTFVFYPGKEAFINGQKASIRKLEQMKKDNPDLGESYDRKIAGARAKIDGKWNVEDTNKVLADLDKLMDEVEVRLKASFGAGHKWLCGEHFSAADINLCVLIGRLTFLGYLFSITESRPSLTKYWQTALQRPTVSETIAAAGEGFK